jgi:hypothetical protein
MEYMPDIGSRIFAGCVSSFLEREIRPCISADEGDPPFSVVVPSWAIMRAGNARWRRRIDLTEFLCLLLGIGRIRGDTYKYAI